MRKTFTLLLLLAYALLTSTSLQAQGERLYSPDGKLLVIVNCSTGQLRSQHYG